jgi:hypothetical protein
VIKAVVVACLKMWWQCGDGIGSSGALAVATWCMLITILIITTMTMIDHSSFVHCGEGGQGRGRRLAKCVAGGCRDGWR